MSEMVYNFDGIDTIGGLISAFVADMNQQLDEVDSAFAAVQDIWSGQAKDAFGPAQAKWHSNATAMGDTLTALVKQLHIVNERVRSTDAGLATLYS